MGFFSLPFEKFIRDGEGQDLNAFTLLGNVSTYLNALHTDGPQTRSRRISMRG